MNTYKIVSRNSNTHTLILENLNTGELQKIDEGKFSELFTKVKDSVLKFVKTAIGDIAVIGNKIISAFVDTDDILRSHSKNAAVYSTDESKNDGSFDEKLRKNYKEEWYRLKQYMLNVMSFYAVAAEIDAFKNNESQAADNVVTESIATREIERTFDKNVEGFNSISALQHVLGYLPDKEKTDDKGNVIGMEATTVDPILGRALKLAAQRDARQSKKESGDDAVKNLSEVQRYADKLYDQLSTGGRVSTFSSAVNQIARFLTMRFTAPIHMGTQGMKGNDPSAFGMKMLFGVPGIGKSAMMGRIKQMIKEGLLSENGETENEVYNFGTGRRTQMGEVVMISIGCEDADESLLTLPARDVEGYKGQLINPETNKRYTRDEEIARMKEVLDPDKVDQMVANGDIGVEWDESKHTRDWNFKYATRYPLKDRITGKPTSDIPLIKVSEYSEELDAKFPPTVVFFDEVLMALPSGLNAIKALLDTRMIPGGEYVLPSRVAFIGTSNRPIDFDMSGKQSQGEKIFSYLQGPTTERFQVIGFAPTFTEFVEWGQQIDPETGLQNVHPDMIDFLMQAEYRCEFCHLFTGTNTDKNMATNRRRSVQRGLTQAAFELYQVLKNPRYMAKVNSEDSATRNQAIDQLIDVIVDVCNANMLPSTAKLFGEYEESKYRGLPIDFYESLWTEKGPKRVNGYYQDESGNKLSTNYSFSYNVDREQYDAEGNMTVVKVPTTKNFHISDQAFAQNAVDHYPYAAGVGPSKADLLPNNEGKIPLLENLMHAYTVMYKNKFVVAGDKSYMQKLVDMLVYKFTGVMKELGLSDNFVDNMSIKKSYLLFNSYLPGIMKDATEKNITIKLPDNTDLIALRDAAGAARNATVSKIQ